MRNVDQILHEILQSTWLLGLDSDLNFNPENGSQAMPCFEPHSQMTILAKLPFGASVFSPRTSDIETSSSALAALQHNLDDSRRKLTWRQPWRATVDEMTISLMELDFLLEISFQDRRVEKMRRKEEKKEESRYKRYSYLQRVLPDWIGKGVWIVCGGGGGRGPFSELGHVTKETKENVTRKFSLDQVQH